MDRFYRDKYLKYKRLYYQRKYGGTNQCPVIDNPRETFDQKIDAGSIGDIYTIRDNPLVVAKLIKIGPVTDVASRTMSREHFQKEVAKTQDVADLGLGPKVICAGYFRDGPQEYGCITQDKLHINAAVLQHLAKAKGVSKDEFIRANNSIHILFTEMTSQGIYNADLSLKNIMFNSDYSKAYMIDSSEATDQLNDRVKEKMLSTLKNWTRSYDFLLKKLN